MCSGNGDYEVQIVGALPIRWLFFNFSLRCTVEKLQNILLNIYQNSSVWKTIGLTTYVIGMGFVVLMCAGGGKTL